MKRILLVFSLVLTTFYLGICYYFSSRIIVPGRASLPSPTELEANFGPLEEVNIRSSDEILLKGWFFDHPESSNCGMILLHGRNSTRYGMRHWMPFFWVKGCDLLLVDQRAHGESEGIYGTFGKKEGQDLLSMHDWMKSKIGVSDKQIGWVGASWGAAAVLQAGERSIQPMFLLADSPFKDLNSAVMERAIRDYGNWIKVLVPTIYWMVERRAGFDPYETSTMESAKGIRTPTLLIHSQTDEATSSDQSIAIANAMNPDMVTFHHTDWGSLHCKDVQDHPDKYEQLINDFLTANGLLHNDTSEVHILSSAKVSD